MVGSCITHWIGPPRVQSSQTGTRGLFDNATRSCFPAKAPAAPRRCVMGAGRSCILRPAQVNKNDQSGRRGDAKLACDSWYFCSPCGSYALPPHGGIPDETTVTMSRRKCRRGSAAEVSSSSGRDIVIAGRCASSRRAPYLPCSMSRSFSTVGNSSPSCNPNALHP